VAACSKILNLSGDVFKIFQKTLPLCIAYHFAIGVNAANHLTFTLFYRTHGIFRV